MGFLRSGEGRRGLTPRLDRFPGKPYDRVMSDSVKIWSRVLLAAVGVTLLALFSSPGGKTGGDQKEIGTTTVAGCVGGEVMMGSGAENWREDSIDAGPVGIREHPLRGMARSEGGGLYTKMPILIDGHDKVTVAIAPGQRDRALLFYGPLAGDANGGAPGFERIRFHPCEDKDRTVFPGGIRVEGSQAIRLKIIVSDEPAFVVSLGRPKPSGT